jgi:hypothetical protein
VDYNSEVHKGDVIAELDKTNLLSELASAKSNLSNYESNLNYQTSNYNRYKTLYEKGLVSTNDYESARLSYEQALQQSRNSFIPTDDKCDRYYADFPIILKSSLKDTVAYLKKNKIEAVRPFSYPLHQYLNLPKEDFPATEHFYLKTILIPNYSSLSKADVTHVTRIITTM